MSDIWNEGYFTDVAYTYWYHRETSPVYQRFCLLLRGLARGDLAATPTHCELGFGQGVSVNINAASNPGRYVATDFNPSHAAHARDMASHGGCDIELHDDSFKQFLARDDLPKFDSISVHGIWTWVSRDNQRAIIKFAARHLKPGGSFYVSYNCFPGWAPVHPVRQALALHNRYVSGPLDTPRRIQDALKFGSALLAASPLFALATPGLEAHLKQVSGQASEYVAPEYFNREWNCMYFTDVAEALAKAKLEFATTAEPLDLVDAINLNSAEIEFLDAIEHPILREQMRDYFVNRNFRKDLYLRGVRRLSASEQREQTLETRLVLTQAVDAIPMVVTGARGQGALHDDIFRPLLDELAARDYAPKSMNELLRALPEVTLPRLVTACATLVGADHAAPCQAEAAVHQVRAKCDALNRHLLDRARTRADVNHLASPVTGSGVFVDRLQQLFLLARTDGIDQPAEWARFTWRLLHELGETLSINDRVLETQEANLAYLTARANAFAEHRVPILRAVGIVSMAG